MAKLTCNVELAIQEIWASSSFILSWLSRMELRTSSILSWLIRVEPFLGLMGLNLWSKRLKFQWTLALGCLSPDVGVWSISSPCNVDNFCRVIRIGILGFEVSPPICGCWVTWLWFKVSPPPPPNLWMLGYLVGVWSISLHLWVLGCLIGVWSVSPRLYVLGFLVGVWSIS